MIIYLWNRFRSRSRVATKHDLEELEKLIIMTTAEAVLKIEALKAQVAKVRQEVLDKIEEIRADVSPEVEEKLNELAAVVQTSDDDNPDKAPPTE